MKTVVVSSQEIAGNQGRLKASEYVDFGEVEQEIYDYLTKLHTVLDLAKSLNVEVYSPSTGRLSSQFGASQYVVDKVRRQFNKDRAEQAKQKR